MTVSNCDHCKKPIETNGIIRICPKCAGIMAKRAIESREAAVKHSKRGDS